MMNGNAMTPADIAAVMGNNNNDGFVGGNGFWWIIVLFLFVFCGWGGNGAWAAGGGYGAQGAAQNYVLSSDFASLQRTILDGNSRTESKLDGIANGISSLGYDQLSQMNNINMNISNNGNATRDMLTQQHFAIQQQLSQCCCDNKAAIADVNYRMATDTCAINTNIANSTRDIIDAINRQSIERKDERIAEQAQQISALQLAASQAAQNTYLINQLRPSPSPAYIVANPYCNCQCGNAGYGYQYGTTIA